MKIEIISPHRRHKLLLVIMLFVNIARHTLCRRAPHSVGMRIAPLSMSSTFFQSIGSPKFISAPMVDQSNLAWRLLVRENGADLAFSQMMHARNFMTDKNYRSDCVDWDDYTHSGGVAEASRSRELDKPLIVQLAGDDPHVLVEAGKYLHKDVAAIDLNLGCPQKIAKKGNYGAYLLPEKALIVKLLSAMVQNLDCPITAKIRCLSTDEETLELCKAIEDCGVSMITVHGRTVDSNKLFVTPANWDIIRKVKETLSIPVIANGGISCRDDAIRLATSGLFKFIATILFKSPHNSFYYIWKVVYYVWQVPGRIIISLYIIS
jgi:tRNA-dihydrouridine synthase